MKPKTQSMIVGVTAVRPGSPREFTECTKIREGGVVVELVKSLPSGEALDAATGEYKAPRLHPTASGPPRLRTAARRGAHVAGRGLSGD